MASPGRAADTYSAETVKAAFLYRFGGYVTWPPDALKGPRFTIAVLGGNEVANELERLLPQHPIQNRPAQVVRIRRVQDADDAQILYVGPGHAADLQAIIAPVARRPILIVSDSEQGLDGGSAVNFLLVDRRVRFEISLAAAERSGLKISAELLSVAARVEGGHLQSGARCPSSLPYGLDSRCQLRVASR